MRYVIDGRGRERHAANPTSLSHLHLGFNYNTLHATSTCLHTLLSHYSFYLFMAESDVVYKCKAECITRHLSTWPANSNSLARPNFYLPTELCCCCCCCCSLNVNGAQNYCVKLNLLLFSLAIMFV